jgi:hypothetical protein
VDAALGTIDQSNKIGKRLLSVVVELEVIAPGDAFRAQMRRRLGGVGLGAAVAAGSTIVSSTGGLALAIRLIFRLPNNQNKGMPMSGNNRIASSQARLWPESGAAGGCPRQREVQKASL